MPFGRGGKNGKGGTKLGEKKPSRRNDTKKAKQRGKWVPKSPAKLSASPANARALSQQRKSEKKHLSRTEEAQRRVSVGYLHHTMGSQACLC